MSSAIDPQGWAMRNYIYSMTPHSLVIVDLNRRSRYLNWLNLSPSYRKVILMSNGVTKF